MVHFVPLSQFNRLDHLFLRLTTFLLSRSHDYRSCCSVRYRSLKKYDNLLKETFVVKFKITMANAKAGLLFSLISLTDEPFITGTRVKSDVWSVCEYNSELLQIINMAMTRISEITSDCVQPTEAYGMSLSFTVAGEMHCSTNTLQMSVISTCAYVCVY
jgi:hypothetical protein